ncbi:unnamed protein product [Prunus armeniaca]|uniref:Uncharacterized protein n=1 Tax=Prunus armeniaca TaxID=36596 RepID=A0A6J5W0G0_PRUAR|nr:unnamed protein product [Prunus armeniaca]CAB4293432.1 unnamed protein product [Prunus armeniaca]
MVSKTLGLKFLSLKTCILGIEIKRLEKTRVTLPWQEFVAIAYSSCLVSLCDVAKGEEVKRLKAL